MKKFCCCTWTGTPAGGVRSGDTGRVLGRQVGIAEPDWVPVPVKLLKPIHGSRCVIPSEGGGAMLGDEGLWISKRRGKGKETNSSRAGALVGTSCVCVATASQSLRISRARSSISFRSTWSSASTFFCKAATRSNASAQSAAQSIAGALSCNDTGHVAAELAQFSAGRPRSLAISSLATLSWAMSSLTKS